MSSEAARSLALEIAERLRGAGEIRVQRFFGGAALVIEGLQIGFVMKGSLFLRVDDLSRPRYEAIGAKPFTYAGARGLITVARYYEAPAYAVEDPDALHDWIKEASRAAAADGNIRRNFNRTSRVRRKRQA